MVYGEVQLTGSFRTNKLKATSRRQAIERQATLLHKSFDGLLMVNQLKWRILPISKEISTGPKQTILSGRQFFFRWGLQGVNGRIRVRMTWAFSFPTSLKPSPKGVVTSWLAGRGTLQAPRTLIREPILTFSWNKKKANNVTATILTNEGWNKI